MLKPFRGKIGAHYSGEARGYPALGDQSVTLRRDTIMTVLALVVLAATIPFAIVDTIEMGRIHLFSRQFIEELPRRFTGPGRLRFISQPAIAIVLGIRSGLADARLGNPPYLFALLFGPGLRRELLRSGIAAIRNLVAAAIVMDVIFQVVLYRSVHPGAAVVIGPILICLPYTFSRALSMRFATLWNAKHAKSSYPKLG
jgi:hypothetical protein